MRSRVPCIGTNASGDCPFSTASLKHADADAGNAILCTSRSVRLVCKDEEISVGTRHRGAGKT